MNPLSVPTRTRPRSALLLGFTSLLLLLPTHAAPPVASPERSPEQVFHFLDFNSDGKLSEAEFGQLKEVAPAFQKNPLLRWLAFRKSDANRDGSLSLDEFRAFVENARKKTPLATPSDAPLESNPLERAPTPDELAFFEKSIRPVLAEYCYECHSAGADSLKGGLRLDTRQGLLEGGESGPAILPGHPEKSLLLEAVRHTQKDLQMPPPKHSGKLPDATLADLERWIRIGAPDPRQSADPAERDNSGGSSKKEASWKKSAQSHWAFQPLKAQTPPEPTHSQWPHTRLDHFVLAQLHAHGLRPMGDAPPEQLLRRLSFDLTGLPPTPETLETFTAKPSPKALETLVDQWLDSPAFGERWARHWLDLARYADSTGRTSNVLFPHAWRYRDYVIHAFQADKPIDQFLREQIAGDLLPAANDSQKIEQTVATAFLALGPKQLSEPDARQFQLDLVDEQLDTLGQAVLGLSIGCARCHDHKFDPISQRDYTALAGIFRSTDTLYGTAPVITNNHASQLLLLPQEAPRLSASLAPTLLKSQIQALEKELRSLYQGSGPGSFKLPEDPEKLRRSIGVRSRLAVAQQRLRETGNDGYALPLTMGVREARLPVDLPLYSRGDPSKPLAPVPRGIPALLPLPTPAIETGSGRRELADWIASPENPLTARVFVNRVWQHLFGKGLVGTPDNFGLQGEPPSHPELLDDLTLRFIQNGWSLKHLVREIVLSRTYQLASDFHPDNHAIDPENIWLWRMSPRRLEAETVRDALLSITAQLRPKPPLGSLAAKIGDSFSGIAALRAAQEAQSGVRSIYLTVLRDQTNPILGLFDFPNSNSVTGSREETTTASQALFLLNNPFLQTFASHWAQQLLSHSTHPQERLERAFRQTFARSPSPSDVQAFSRFFEQFQGRSETDAWAAFCQALFASAEFRVLH